MFRRNDVLKLPARAKINLTLEVLGRRPDGYHEIASVMQAIDLHDTLEIEVGEGLSLTANWSEVAGPTNLALRAANLLRQTAGISAGARLKLTKRIPLAAGLGGGSSDAAAALLGLNQLWQAGLSSSELLDLASQLGSDVSFFLLDGTALAEGRGERVRRLPPMPCHWVVLLVPDIAVDNKTAYLYGLLSKDDYTSGAQTRAVVESLERGESPDHALFSNVFQDVVLRHFSEVRRWHQRMLELGVERVWLAGSGPTLFTLVETEESAWHLAQLLEAEGGKAFATRTVQVNAFDGGSRWGES